MQGVKQNGLLGFLIAIWLQNSSTGTEIVLLKLLCATII